MSHLLAIYRAVYSTTATSKYALIMEDDIHIGILYIMYYAPYNYMQYMYIMYNIITYNICIISWQYILI